jgi:hypothetical protein
MPFTTFARVQTVLRDKRDNMMKRRGLSRYRWLFSIAAAALLPLGALIACATPNGIGVQDTGTIVGTVYDTSTNQGVANVLVSVGSLYTVRTDGNGNFSIQAPVGVQQVHVAAPAGYSGSTATQVDVQKNATVTVPPFGLTPGG